MADFEQELKKPVLQRAKLKLQQWCMKVRFREFLSGKAKITRLKGLQSMSVDRGNKNLNVMVGAIPQALGLSYGRQKLSQGLFLGHQGHPIGVMGSHLRCQEPSLVLGATFTLQDNATETEAYPRSKRSQCVQVESNKSVEDRARTFTV